MLILIIYQQIKYCNEFFVFSTYSYYRDLVKKSMTSNYYIFLLDISEQL